MLDVRKLGEQLRNWGRWGPDDERGALNLVTPDRLVNAARLVERGEVLSLGLQITGGAPFFAVAHRPPPVHYMRQDGGDDVTGDNTRGWDVHVCDDYIAMPCHTGTHWDSFAHFYYGNQIYNGFASSNIGSHGAKRGSIDQFHTGIAGRGVLLDIASLKGVDTLADRYAVTPDELTAAVKRQNVEVGAGDIVLVRTGALGEAHRRPDPNYVRADSPGLDVTCLEWLGARDVAALAVDNLAVEVYPTNREGHRCVLPLHEIALRDMGLPLGELFVLDELAAHCRADGRWDFMFVGPPLRITKGVGSPVNPLVFK